MLHVVLRTIGHLLPVNPHGPMAVCTTNIGALVGGQVSDRNFDPAGFFLAFDFIKPLDGTPSHHVTRHREFSPGN
jgi:hypothetical protein